MLLLFTGCAWLTEEELAAIEDADSDGFPVWEDCDDALAEIGALETRFEDADGDGVGGAELLACPDLGVDVGGDCDDADAAVVGPTDWYTDGDVDGVFGSAALSACEQPDATWTADAGLDCDDANAAIYPGALEDCSNGVDDDCDAEIDECGLRDAGLVLYFEGDEGLGRDGGGLGHFPTAYLPVSDGYYQLVVGMPYHTGEEVAVYAINDEPHVGRYPLDSSAVYVVDDTPGYAGSNLVVAELDGDGVWDLAVAASVVPAVATVGIAWQPNEDSAGIDFTYVGESDTSQIGLGLSAGDVDDDGYEDLVLGAPAEALGCGAAYLVFGGPDPHDQVNAYYNDSGRRGAKFYTPCDYADKTIEGGFGSPVLAIPPSVSEARTALIALSDPTRHLLTGAVYVWQYEGSLPEVPRIIDVSSDHVSMWTGENESDGAGFALASGDFNANGVADLVIGAPFARSGVGTVGVVFDIAEVSGEYELEDADVVFVGDEVQPSSAFGGCVAAVDSDGDGTDELAVGAPHWGGEAEPRGYEAGAVYLYAELEPGTFGVDDASRQLYGAYGGERAGSALSAADLDGDGTEELVVGADGWSLDGVSPLGALVVVWGAR